MAAIRWPFHCDRPPIRACATHAPLRIQLTTIVKEVMSIGQARLRGVDALRGAAAMGVVLYHEVGSKPRVSTGTIWNWLASPLWAISSFGYAGVFLFFVISGFCIHLQWARRRTVDGK